MYIYIYVHIYIYSYIFIYIYIYIGVTSNMFCFTMVLVIICIRTSSFYLQVFDIVSVFSKVLSGKINKLLNRHDVKSFCNLSNTQD